MLTEDETELILDGLPPPGANPTSNKLRTRLSNFLREIRQAPDNPSPPDVQKSPKQYRNPALTVDAAVVRGRKENLQLLLVTRGRPPFEGQLAFPGGFVDYGEDPHLAVVRELEEECGVKGKNPKLVAVRGDPERDSRQHIVTVCYHIHVDDSATVLAGDDAAQCGWYPIEDLLKDDSKLAFDHDALLRQFVTYLEVNGLR